MIPFRGNCEQVRLLEQLIRHLGGKKIWKVESGDNEPLFAGQDEFKPLITYRKYLIRTNPEEKFFPDIYSIKFVYNEDEKRAEVHMPREVADFLIDAGVEQVKELDIIVRDKPEEVPAVMDYETKPAIPKP
jgi:hypothetical protein